MQPGARYQFVNELGTCQVGKVWSAVDEQGRPLTVAVLDATAAADPRWRNAFAATADAIGRPEAGGPRLVHADFSAATPWAAYANEGGPGAERVFQTLGLEYQPLQPGPNPDADGQPAPDATQMLPTITASSADPTTAPPASVDEAGPAEAGTPAGPQNAQARQSFTSEPVSAVPSVTSAPPQSTSEPAFPAWAPSPAPIPQQPVSGAPVSPVSGAPVSGGPVSPPVSPAATDVSSPYDPFSYSVQQFEPVAPPPKRRTGLWVGLAVVAVLLVGIGVVIFTDFSANNEPKVNTTSLAPAPIPTSPPQSPGVEPPKPAAWPTQWPKYTDTDNVRTLNLEGLGFPVKVPLSWQCSLAARADGYVKYHCGTSPGEHPEVGGELIVRDCPQPCSEEQQNTMRQAEEAWGAQWMRSGQYATYGEQLIFVDGEQRHALVVVAYFRSGSEGLLDRQLVLRMTAPQSESYQLRRFATWLRDTLIF